MRRIAVAAGLVLVIGVLLSGCGRVRVRPPQPGQRQEGLASYYDGEFVGRHTASGEIMDRDRLTAAHRTFPFGTTVRVTNLDNGLETTVRINDRGPFVRGRILDLTLAGARALDMIVSGVAKVRLEVLAAPPPDAQIWVQVGAFKGKDNADRLREQVSDGFLTTVVEKDGFYKVRLGPYARERDASAAADRARDLGLPAIIVVER